MTTRILFIGGFLATAAASQAASSFLYLDGIKGEASSVRHAGWIEIEAFSMGSAQTTNRATLQPITFAKQLDRASPILLQHTADARTITNAVFEVYRDNEKSLRLLRLKLGEARLIDFNQSGAAGSSPYEHFSLSCKTIAWTYSEVTRDGRALRDITSAWNLSTGETSGGAVLADTDGDGMPDDYEKQFGLNDAADDSTADLDGDGMTNIEEFRAGTAPNSSNSIFQVTGSRTPSGGTTLQWEASSEKTYRLMGTSSPELPFVFIRFLTETEVAAGQLALEPGGLHNFYILEAD